MKILIAGDFAPRGELAIEVQKWNFGMIFPDGLVKVIKSADFSLVNLESPVAGASYKPILKCGPNLNVLLRRLKLSSMRALTA